MQICLRMNKRQSSYLSLMIMLLVMIVLLMTVIAYEKRAEELHSDKGMDIYGRHGTAVSTDELELKIVCSGQYELIKVWRKGSGEDNDRKKYDSDELYAFLPAGADIEQVSLYYNDRKLKVLLDGRTYKSGEDIEDLKLMQPYELVVEESDGSIHSRLTFVQSANLPAAFITTESGSTTKLRQDKNNKESGTFKLIDIDGTVDYDGKLEWISGRGNSSWNFEKRPYIIKFKDDTKLLGMDAASKWVLFANAFDYADGLRNQMAYQLAANVGMEYSCDLKFIDLYINEIYAGTYQICEKIEVHKNRLDIGYLDEANEEMNPGLKSLEGTYADGVGLDIKTPRDHSGGYVLERNYGSKLTDKPFYFTTKNNEGFVVRAPSMVSDVEMDYIRDCFQSVENAILSDNGIDEISGKYYTELIDIESWAKKFLMNVVTKGESIGDTSSYFYKKQGDDHIYAGPAWDFDKSFARQEVIGDPNILMDSMGETQWWPRVYDKSEFHDMTVKYYWEDFRPYLMKMADQYIDEWAEYIAGSNEMNWIRWPESAKDYYFPDEMAAPGGEGLGNATEFLKDWLRLRVAYLDSLWPKE